ncbi:hypothetical protein TNCV_538651 [Trichonephila clavipes]|nr:hypothetical protein TNCV_538651 [Trichonephila clavipes]
MCITARCQKCHGKLLSQELFKVAAAQVIEYPTPTDEILSTASKPIQWAGDVGRSDDDPCCEILHSSPWHLIHKRF